MQIAKNDVLSFYIATQESTKAHGFHALGAGGREFESRHSDQDKSHDTALEMATVSWLYLLYKCSENAGLCVFCALLAQKLLTEQTELNRELCTALHCSTRTKCAILFMGQDRHFITAPPEKRLNMLSDAKKKANAKWDKAHMMILGCKVRKDFAAQFREACTAAGTTPNAVLKQAAEQFLKEHAVSEEKTAVEECA